MPDLVRDEYDRWWNVHFPNCQGAGPTSPLGPQHAGHVHAPLFGVLCARAKAKGLTVGLSVSEKAIERLGNDGVVLRHRTLRYLRVLSGKKLLASRLVGSDLDLASQGVSAQVGL